MSPVVPESDPIQSLGGSGASLRCVGKFVRLGWVAIGWIAAVSVLVLLPWWRNHAYLRDFYDYGLVMAGVGRIDAGERPYVDFGTPIQSGIFLWNWAAELFGGETYQALTWGGGVFTVLAFVVLAWILRRRWPWPAAATVAGAVVCGGVAQHTIIWHNSVGVVSLAVVAWVGAMFPVLRREARWWHVGMGLALVLGGMNKLNTQLLALAVAVGWALRAGLAGRAGWGRVGATWLFVAIWGAVLPVAAELAWTGAPLKTWWYNVVTLPLGDRAPDLAATLHPGFYLTPRHNYYGTLLLPQVGLAGGVLVTLALAGAWTRGRTPAGFVGRWLLVAAAVLAFAGGAALLATNQEIAYVAMAAWLVLAAGLWLGFEVPARGARYWGGLVVPAALLGAVAWHSAWRGQRSQFGYSSASRAEYRLGETAGYTYLRGTRIPPETWLSLHEVADTRRSFDAHQKSGIFYGAGLEWLERAWPATKVPRLPLWIHWNTSYGPRERALLHDALNPGGAYRIVLVPIARDDWEPGSRNIFDQNYHRYFAGPVAYWYGQSKPIKPGAGVLQPFDFINNFGGNTDARLLSSGMMPQEASGGRLFYGVSRGTGELTLDVPTLRVNGEVVLRRLDSDRSKPAVARFVISVRPEQVALWERWAANVELPAGQEEVFVPYAVDSGAMPLEFSVTIPLPFAGRIAAGWRGPQIMHAIEGAGALLSVQQHPLPEEKPDPAAIAALLPTGWRPGGFIVRGGRKTESGFALAPGGEVWMQVPTIVSEISGVATVPAESAMPAQPIVRVFWYKGGRLECTSQGGVRFQDRRMEFRVWSAEPGGWIGFAVDPNPKAPAVIFRVTTAKPAE